MLSILRHRKGFLAMCAQPLMPVQPDGLNLRDFTRVCGGETFSNCMRQLSHDDHGLANWIEVLRLGMLY